MVAIDLSFSVISIWSSFVDCFFVYDGFRFFMAVLALTQVQGIEGTDQRCALSVKKEAMALRK